MDWSKKAEEVLKTWTTSQQSMWDSWIKTVQGIGSNTAGDTWGKSVETWEESVKRVLEAQNAWTQFLAESIASVPGTNQQTTDWSKQLLDMSKRWTDTQNQLWDNWFATVKKTDPTTLVQNWNTEELQKIVQTWQESAQKALESQMELTRMWASAQGQQEKK